MGLLGDAAVLGMGERCRVLADDLLPAASDHLAEGVVDCQDPVLEIDEDHAGHVVLEREAEALLAIRERLGGSKLGGDGVQLDLGADVLCCFLGAVVADCHDGPRLAVKYERREGGVDRDLTAVLAQELEAQVARHCPRDRVPGELAAMRDVAISVPGRHEHLDGLADQLVARVAGQGLEAFVRVADHPVLVDVGDPVG